MRITFYKENNEAEPMVVNVSTAKKLLKQKGGSAWTEHYDRDGSLQETTPIVLGNNANTTYRAIYNTSRCYKK